jgi:hypothetical protein
MPKYYAEVDVWVRAKVAVIAESKEEAEMKIECELTPLQLVRYSTKHDCEIDGEVFEVGQNAAWLENVEGH